MGDSLTTIPDKAVFSQDTAPSNPEEGDLWRDTSTSTLKQWDGNNWTKVSPDLSPLRTDIAELMGYSERQDLELAIQSVNHDDGFIDIFYNSDSISATTGDATVVTGTNGRVNLISVGSTASRDSDVDSTDETSARGIEINPNNDLSGIKATLSSQQGLVDKVFVSDSEGNVITEKTGGFSSGDVVRLEAQLTTGNNYYVGCYDNGNTYTLGKNSTAGHPHTSTDIDITAGANDIYNTFPSVYQDPAYCISDVTALKTGTSGTLTHSRKTLDSVPNTIQADPEYVLNGQTLELIVRDNSGNSVTITEPEFGTEVDTSSFQDADIQAEWQLSSDGTATPEIQKTLITGVQ